MSDKKEDKKSDKKGDDKKKGGDKKAADKPAGGDKPKGGDNKKADKKSDDKKGGDKSKAAAADDKKADKKDDAKPAAAAAADAPAAGAGAAAADDKSAEKNNKKNKKSKKDDDKSAAPAAGGAEPVELSHVDPNAPVPQPNKAQFDQDTKTLEKLISDLDKQITKLSTTIDAKNAERAKVRSSKNDLYEDHKKKKEAHAAIQAQVQKLTTKYEEIVAERKNSRSRLDATQKSLRYTNPTQLEDAIKDIEMQIATSSHSLATEKKLMADLKVLKTQRSEVAEFHKEKEKVDAQNKAKEQNVKSGDIKQQRDALKKEESKLWREEKDAWEKIREIKAADSTSNAEVKALVVKRRESQNDKYALTQKVIGLRKEYQKREHAYFKFQQQQQKLKGDMARAARFNRERQPPAAAEGTTTPAALPDGVKGYVVPRGERPGAGEGNRRKKAGGGGGGGGGGDEAPTKSKKPSVAGPDGEDDPANDEDEMERFEIVPFAREKLLCDKLTRYLVGLQQKFKSETGAAAGGDKKDEKKSGDVVLVQDRNAGFKGKPVEVIKKDKNVKLEDLFGKDVSKSNASVKPQAKKAGTTGSGGASLGAERAGDKKDSKVVIVAASDKKAAGRAAAKKKALTHQPLVFTEFKELKLNAPTDASQIEAAIKELADKKAYFETNPIIMGDGEEEPTPEPVAAASAAGDVKAAPAAAADSAAAADKAMDDEKQRRIDEEKALKEAVAKETAATRKKGAKAADAAAEAERVRRVAEAAAEKSKNADEEKKERTRRKSLASEAEDAEQKRRVEEAEKAKKDAADEEAKTRNNARRNSLKAMDDEQKRRIAAGEGKHDKPSVIAQVDKAEHTGDAKAAPAAAGSEAAAAPATGSGGSAAGAAGSDLVKSVNADLSAKGFDAFAPNN